MHISLCVMSPALLRLSHKGPHSLALIFLLDELEEKVGVCRSIYLE